MTQSELQPETTQGCSSCSIVASYAKITAPRNSAQSDIAPCCWILTGQKDLSAGEKNAAKGSLRASDRPCTRSGWIARWSCMVQRTKQAQPDWVTPLATTSPVLSWGIRYDFLWLDGMPAGASQTTYGGGKGFRLIPAPRAEIYLNIPAYLVHHNSGSRDGTDDLPLLLKLRMVSRNETRGDYILTLLIGATLPTGSATESKPAATITPSIAYGKGFCHLVAQGTFGIRFPTSKTSWIGRTYVWNNTFQYMLLDRRLLPEVEINSMFFS